MAVVPLRCFPGARFWDREADAELLCVDVRAETRDMATFTFVGPDRPLFSFDPGQYFTFEIPFEDGIEHRCYSISSSPLRPASIAITVKRTDGGRVSNWLHDRLKPGDTLRALGPVGQFTPPPGDTAGKLLLLSGGSGITPMMSIARAYADACLNPDIVFLHAARTQADFAFRDELLAMTSRPGPFRLVLLPETTGMGETFAGPCGRLSPGLLQALVPDCAERRVMCCGPAPFMAAARTMCVEQGVPPGRYQEESFDFAEEAGDGAAPEVAGATKFSVTFSRQARTIPVSAGQSILAAARAQGIVLPSSCANGLCGTCKSKLLGGEVEMRHNGGIRQREIDAGLILPCCATPLSDVVIER
jgi:3-phenylpropionate/trans-cinnamate dioxygenase ferredoxin reductase subunit